MIGIHKKTLLFQECQCISLALGQLAFAINDIVGKNRKVALCRDFGIKLPQGTSSGISGIGKKRLSGLFPLLIQFCKIFFGQIGFTANNKLTGERNLQRYGKNCFDVFRDILPDSTISPGSAPDKETVFIFQSYGKPIDLPLHNVLRRIHAFFYQAMVKILQILGGKSICQTITKNTECNKRKTYRKS